MRSTAFSVPRLLNMSPLAPLPKRLSAYGCSRVVMLDADEPTAELVNYLDLLPRRGQRQTSLPVHAAVGHQGTTLLYVVDAANGADSTSSLVDVQRMLANRSEPAWLGVMRPGQLEIYPIDFRSTQPVQKPVASISPTDERAPMFFQSLVHGTFLKGSKKPNEADFVFRRVYDLLTMTSKAFLPNKLLSPLDVLSVCGRALFFRFLIDRRIVREAEVPDICPSATNLKDAFSSIEKAASTSAWLDATFNGDFLPLVDEDIPSHERARRQKAYQTFFQRLFAHAGNEIFRHLEAILNGWEYVDGTVQLELDWGELDFAHIPIGVLSQVYESFSHLSDPNKAQQESVHYTPRAIAELMVDEAFAATPHPAKAHVLDPACGGGIFLVLAFRRLVREKWILDEKRPDTRTLQKILYSQICGFDISESALRLAALALYITAIELNGTQHPPISLKFPRNLRKEVLHLFDSEEKINDSLGRPLPPFRLGSLGSHVSETFNERFDIVLGNPPWTRLREPEAQGRVAKGETKGKKKNKTPTDLQGESFTEIGQRVLKGRGLEDLSATFKNPDKTPDLPFLFRAMEWAKEGGHLAFALPARLILHPTARGSEPWQAVLKAVSMTGLINGADLRKTAVWEGMDIPWCLLFARNIPAPLGQLFRYVTPSYERPLNRHGRFRIDYESTQPVSTAQVAAHPWILKTLSLGTWRDVELVETVKRTFPQTLLEVWKKWTPKEKRTGLGVNRSPELPQNPREFFRKFKHFEPRGDEFKIDHPTLRTYEETFGSITAHKPRTEFLYQPPLVLVTEARPARLGPGSVAAPELPRAYYSDQPLTFTSSYYGYSCAGHAHAETLAALLYLLPQSILFDYFCLMTSAGIGADRQTLNKEEFDALPFPDVATLPEAVQTSLQTLAKRVQEEAKKPWDEVDTALFQLYGLKDDAVQIARDTLYSAAAHRKAGQAAFQGTTSATRSTFSAALRGHLEPFFEVCGHHVTVDEPAGWEQDVWREAWVFVAVSREGVQVPVDQTLMRKAMLEADRRAASRIVVRGRAKTGVLLGLLNQGRWWTRTRALMCAQHLVRHSLSAFGLPEIET